MANNQDKEKMTVAPETTAELPDINPLQMHKNNFSSNDIGVRSALNALGFENDGIGYNGNDVTYNGMSIVTPTDNVNGVTKTDTNGLISGVNNYNKKKGKDDYVVDVTSYAAMESKLPNSVKYNQNGTVTLGGIPIENAVIIDGNSYAPKSAIEAAVKKLKESTGYTTHSELARDYLSRTENSADKYMDKINNYAPFAYDPENDPVYKAYAAMYERNAKRAHEDILHMNNAKTGGYGNSAAITSANQAYYNHMSELNDRIPELASNAYKRYADEYDRLWRGLEAYGTPVDRYNIAAKAGGEDIDSIYNALLQDYNRDIENRNFNYQSYIDGRDFDYKQKYDSEQMAYKEAMDAWERENILIPRSLLYMQEYDFNNLKNPLALQLEEEKLSNQKLDNKVITRRYGIK